MVAETRRPNGKWLPVETRLSVEVSLTAEVTQGRRRGRERPTRSRFRRSRQAGGPEETSPSRAGPLRSLGRTSLGRTARDRLPHDPSLPVADRWSTGPTRRLNRAGTLPLQPRWIRQQPPGVPPCPCSADPASQPTTVPADRPSSRSSTGAGRNRRQRRRKLARHSCSSRFDGDGSGRPDATNDVLIIAVNPPTRHIDAMVARR